MIDARYWQRQSWKAYRDARKCAIWAGKTLPQYRQWWLEQAEYHRGQARKYARWYRESVVSNV